MPEPNTQTPPLPLALSALHPRDEIEVLLGVQAMSAHHAAMACWYLGMNIAKPNATSTRHITAACSAARAFDPSIPSSAPRTPRRQDAMAARHA
jgi:hypothetical protein